MYLPVIGAEHLYEHSEKCNKKKRKDMAEVQQILNLAVSFDQFSFPAEDLNEMYEELRTSTNQESVPRVIEKREVVELRHLLLP